ncbi:MAG: efflux RND transporter periplasmic adaptor subunit [Alphaproteobacteria bacterium]|nr:efflux RND transporter periplasmic adaptor subunit [Alphaproteobacteria bacterium]MBV9370060.1 efflux RND transporter periplasmic adaptor subunit [Alphaproteobacteria bacterium]MBV9900734.1 efflux RND transporter periplasmic adaptor subunit [Alphaproteobacteria bacterium]
MNFESPKWRRSALDVEVADDGAARRRRRNIILAVVAVLAVAVAAFLMMGRGSDKTAVTVNAKGGAAEAAPAVTVVVPGRQQIARTISATGQLAARHDMPVGVPGEGGQIVQVLVEAGQWVGAGQTLAVIDRSLQTQEAAQLAAQIQVAQADARLAQQELDRAQKLVGRGFVSKADVERRIATRDAANARVRVAQANLGQSRARIGRLSIRAPAAGLVLTRSVEPGQVVGAGSSALFHIARGGEMEMMARLPESDLARITPGVQAMITPVGSDRAYPGAVWQVAPIIDPQSRQGVARVAVAYNRDLRPGGFATAEIKAGAVDAPLLPESAVLNDGGGSYAFIVDGQNVVRRRAVKVAAVTDDGVVVGEGLTGNERVVLSAGPFLTEGEKIRPQRAAAAAATR